MPPSSAPVFGRRGRVSAPPAPPAAPTRESEHAAFFAAVRCELAEAEPDCRRVVPRSSRAALLAGLCVGFALVGLDLTRTTETIRGLAGPDADPGATTTLLPILLMLGLLGGARAAATSLLVTHWLLRRVGLTHHLAYAGAGAAVAAAVAALLGAAAQTGLVDPEHVPTHGPVVDALAGAGAGFLYRVFAGSRSA